jgi:hypothetical protein
VEGSRAHARGQGEERGHLSTRRLYRVRQNLSFVIRPFSTIFGVGALKAYGACCIMPCTVPSASASAATPTRAPRSWTPKV